jgi:hypothetical protein
MRVLKTEDCFYVGAGNASDTNTGSFGDASNYGESAGVTEADRATAMASLAASVANLGGRNAMPGCNPNVSAAQYNTIAQGWATLGMVASPFATFNPVALGVTVGAGVMAGYNYYCGWDSKN